MAVYVLVDETRCCCKIGFSKSYEQTQERVKGLQTANPFKLEVLAINPYLEMEDERRLHKKLEGFLTGGGREWFDLRQPEVLEAIEYVSTALVFRESQEPVKPNLACENASACENAISIFDRIVNEYAEEYADEINDLDFEFCKSYITEALEVIFDDAMRNGLDAYFDREDSIESNIDDFLSMVLDFPFSEDKGNNSGIVLYLGIESPEDAKHITIGELIDFLMEGFDGIEDKIKATVLALKISSGVFAEDVEGEIPPDIFLYNGLILIVYDINFQDGMHQAEMTYSDLFWDVDEFGSQLFVFCVNSARDRKEIPYGWGG